MCCPNALRLSGTSEKIIILPSACQISRLLFLKQFLAIQSLLNVLPKRLTAFGHKREDYHTAFRLSNLKTLVSETISCDSITSLMCRPNALRPSGTSEKIIILPSACQISRLLFLKQFLAIRSLLNVPPKRLTAFGHKREDYHTAFRLSNSRCAKPKQHLSPLLFRHNHHGVLFNTLSGSNLYLFDRTGTRRANLVFHLHRFKNEKRLVRFYRIPVCHKQLDN